VAHQVIASKESLGVISSKKCYWAEDILEKGSKIDVCEFLLITCGLGGAGWISAMAIVFISYLQ
jgi:hypothetical protein